MQQFYFYFEFDFDFCWGTKDDKHRLYKHICLGHEHTSLVLIAGHEHTTLALTREDLAECHPHMSLDMPQMSLAH